MSYNRLLIHLLVRLFVRLPACLLARSPTHSFTHSFVFCLWGFYSSFYSFLCSFLCGCECVCACVCMAPLLSLDTLLAVVIPFYHYVNSESKREWEKKADISFLFSLSLCLYCDDVWRNKIAGLSLWNSWSDVLIKLKRALQNSC